MLGPRPWTEFEHDPLGFAALLGITPAARYKKFFRAAEKAESRIGVVTPRVEVTDQIVQALVLWFVMIRPDAVVAVCHRTQAEGRRWVYELEQMVATGDERLHKELLFAEDKSAVRRTGFDGWNVVTCRPDLLVNVSVPLRLHHDAERPFVIVLDPVDLLTRERMDAVVAMRPTLLVCTTRPSRV